MGASAILLVTLLLKWLSFRQQKNHQANELALKVIIKNLFSRPDLLDRINLPKSLQKLPILLLVIEQFDKQYQEKSTVWLQIRTELIKKYLLAEVNKHIFHSRWQNRLLGVRSLACAGRLAKSLNNIEERLPSLFADKNSMVRFHAVRAAVLLISKKTLASALQFLTTQRELTQTLYYSIFEKTDPKITTYLREIHAEIGNATIKNTCEYLLNINQLKN